MSMISRKAFDASGAGWSEASSGSGALIVLVAMWYERPIWVDVTASRQKRLGRSSCQLLHVPTNHH